MSETLEPGIHNDDGRSMAAHVVLALFDRHSVPERKRAKTVERMLSISYQAALRRLNSDASWSLEELERLASHFGESLVDLFADQHAQKGVDATVVIGAFQFPARAWLGDDAGDNVALPFVAHQEGSRWIVSPSVEGADGVPVTSLLWQPHRLKRFRVAIVDDELETVEGITAYLSEVGFDAEPFHTFDEMLNAREQEDFDAYLLDWWVGPTTATSTIAAIRRSDPKCLIGVLTGQMQTGTVTSSEIATVIQRFDVAPPFEKPARGPILAAWLHQRLSKE